MKPVALMLALLSCAAAFGDAIDPNYKKFANTRRYCVSRKCEGDNVITVWYRNGKPDWINPAVVTNKAKHIVGKEQHNALQNQLENTYASYTNQVEQTVAYSNLYIIASVQAEAANEKIQDEIGSLEAKVIQYESDKQTWIQKAPALEADITAYFNAQIADAEERIKSLEAKYSDASDKR